MDTTGHKDGAVQGVIDRYLTPHWDPRGDLHPLGSSWSPSVFISLAYVIGVYAWRSELKRRQCKPQITANGGTNEKKAQLSERWGLVKTLMVFYNVVMVLSSAYVTIGIALHYPYGNDPNRGGQLRACQRRSDVLYHFGYIFYFSKFVEMLDTVFFLWRGKVDQVTFLHVFHHASMPPSIWWGVRYESGGMVFTFPLANSFIHVIMYTYYGLAAAGMYKYLWWKNYLTLAQMIQFVFLILHQGQIFFQSTPCDYPHIFPAAIIFYASVFLVLFGNFYIKAYWRKQRLAKRTTSQSESNGVVRNKPSKLLTNGHVTHSSSPSVARKRRD